MVDPENPCKGCFEMHTPRTDFFVICITRWEDLEGLQFQGCPVCLSWSLGRHGIEARTFHLGTWFDTAGRTQASSSNPGPVMHKMGWACKGRKASEPQFAQLCNTDELYTCYVISGSTVKSLHRRQVTNPVLLFLGSTSMSLCPREKLKLATSFLC